MTDYHQEVGVQKVDLGCGAFRIHLEASYVREDSGAKGIFDYFEGREIRLQGIGYELGEVEEELDHESGQKFDDAQLMVEFPVVSQLELLDLSLQVLLYLCDVHLVYIPNADLAELFSLDVHKENEAGLYFSDVAESNSLAHGSRVLHHFSERLDGHL